MQPMYYIGLDVHKRKISCCVKDPSGLIYSQGSIPATRYDLDCWMKILPQPWSAAMEATMFTGWIYDHLKPHAAGNSRSNHRCGLQGELCLAPFTRHTAMPCFGNYLETLGGFTTVAAH